MVASAGQEATRKENEMSLGNNDISVDDERPIEVSDRGAEAVRRKLPKCSGVYIQGQVCGIPVWYTVDTGASRTIVSKRILGKIPEERSPEIKSDQQAPLEQADGNPLQIDGTALMTLQLGEHMLIDKEVLVADIKDDVLLGMDIGENMDVVTSERHVKIDNKVVPCTHIRGNRLLKVTAADTYCIPGSSEAEIEVYVEDSTDLHVRESQLIIEPKQEFAERYSMVMARSIVDLSRNVTGRVRVINPFDKESVIRQDAVIGQAESMDEVVEVGSWVSDGDVEGLQNHDLVEPRGPKPMSRDILQKPSGTGVTEKVSQERSTPTKVDTQNSSTRSAVAITGKARGISGHNNAGNTWEPTVVTESGTRQEIPEHLMEMWNKASEGKTENEQRNIRNMICNFSDVFSVNDMDLGRTHLTQHEIPTGDSRPVKQPPRRVPMALVKEEAEAIQNLRRQGVIRESSSPWASPIVLVRKKNGKIRPCVDYRRVNSLTQKDAYPIPRTQECLDAMAGSIIFSTLDMTSSYFQIPIKEEDIHKTAFVTRQGLYEFTTMPFGLTNAPATFQRLMELVCRGLQWSCCLIYLDDILVFGKTPEEHAERLQVVLGRVHRAGLKLKPEKCELFQEKVQFLGHIVSAAGIQPDPTNTSKIRQWPEPRTVTEVRQFLGLCSYYRRFVKNFSIIAKPLSDLTSKESELNWTTACQVAFDELKAKLVGPDITAFPCDAGPFILDTDACDVGIGAVLSQVQDGVERVIAYASRSLNRAERNYCVTDKELLAVRYFVEYFRHYLLGRTFCVRTDHQAIKWLFQLKEPKGRIARWIEILSAFNFSVEYRPGKKHGNADGLSRCPNPRDCHCPDNDNLEYLKCGPCNKCRKRSTEMQFDTTGDDRVQAIHVTNNQEAEPTDGNTGEALCSPPTQLSDLKHNEALGNDQTEGTPEGRQPPLRESSNTPGILIIILQWFLSFLYPFKSSNSTRSVWPNPKSIFVSSTITGAPYQDDGRLRPKLHASR